MQLSFELVMVSTEEVHVASIPESRVDSKHAHFDVRSMGHGRQLLITVFPLSIAASSIWEEMN